MNKINKLQSNFTEIALRHGCSLLNLLHILGTPFLKSTSEGLLLKVAHVITGVIELPKAWLRIFSREEMMLQVVFFHKIIQALLLSYLQSYYDGVSEGVYLTHSTTQNKESFANSSKNQSI